LAAAKFIWLAFEQTISRLPPRVQRTGLNGQGGRRTHGRGSPGAEMNSTKSQKPKSLVTAFLLNALLFPAGYVYAGQLELGLAVYVALILISIGLYAASVASPPGIFALVGAHGPNLLLPLAIAAVLGLHAAVLARRNRPALKGAPFWLAIIGLPLVLIVASIGARQITPYPLYDISSVSSLPTIQKGDLVVTNGRRALCGAIRPQRGEMVVYNHGATSYLKRLIGLPGDTVQLRDGTVIVNGTKLSQTVQGQANAEFLGFSTKVDIVRETLPGGRSYQIYLLDRSQPSENTNPVTLAPNRYFFLGDNRDNSLDSRFEAPVAGDRLCGVVIKIVNSQNRAHIGMVP
jgi:signal peptidase I